MKAIQCCVFLVMSVIVSCSSAPDEKKQIRSISSLQSVKMISPVQVRTALKGIFHSYVMGQSLLHKFDATLDKKPEGILESDLYSELLSIRTIVDEHEDHLIDFYLNLALVSALPDYTTDQKARADGVLKEIGQFMEGLLWDHRILPESLKAVILGNLRENQTLIYDELKMLRDDSSITSNESSVQEALDKHLINIRATRLKYFKETKNLSVSKEEIESTLNRLSKDKDFINFKAEVKKQSVKIKALIKTVHKGRSTSSDTIFPSAGAAGNISGRGFPANTWSLTFDDGPGSKTTPTVVQNLVNRNMKATFFMLAKQVEGLPNTSKSVLDAGMDVANHSYDHTQLKASTPVSVLEKQIGTSKAVIEKKLGTVVKLFRLPYGAGMSVPAIRAKIAQHGMVHVFWNVDTLDWQDKNPTSIMNRALKQMAASPNNSGVILFHDIHSQSVTASALLMDQMKKKKIIVCTVQGVIDQVNKGLASCQ